MRADITRKLFTVDEYHRMGDAGIFDEDDRVELIAGEIVQMSPIGLRHMACVDRSNDLLTSRLRGRAIISVQHPLRLNEYSEPQPDIVILRRRPDYYASKPHTPEDTFLVLEVSDATWRYDINVKLPLYSAAGISEVWIANLPENLLLVCRDPVGERYAAQSPLPRGASVYPLAFPDIVFKVEEILGGE